MSVAAANHHSIGLAGAAEIIRVAALAPHQFRVFAATDRLTDAEFGQRKRDFGGSVIHFGRGFRWRVVS
jgi:hypothetical protein